MGQHPSISLCMIVKNEEENLPRVLSSVRGLVDEIIVVDTGSTDRSAEVARAYGARVFTFEWCDDFSAARNESLRHATRDHILWLDGDDEVPREEIPKIKRHLSRNAGSAVFLRVKSPHEGAALECSQLRIFPNGKGIRFEGRIHEQVYYSAAAKGVIFSHCDACVVHHGYDSPAQLYEKMMRNRAMLEKVVSDDPDDFNAVFFLARTIKGLGRKKEALQYLDRAIELGRGRPEFEMTAIYKLSFLEKGLILAETGRTREAAEIMEESLSCDPDQESMRFSLGELYFLTGDLSRAYENLKPLKEARFEKELLPMNLGDVLPKLARYLGISALHEGDLARAEECLCRALIFDPVDRSLYHYLSLARETSGDIEGALAACAEGMEAAGDDGTFRKRRLLLFVKKEDFAAALAEYDYLNGLSQDVEVVASMFFVACRFMDFAAIGHHYEALQTVLGRDPQPFPEDYTWVAENLNAVGLVKARDNFTSGISFLLNLPASV